MIKVDVGFRGKVYVIIFLDGVMVLVGVDDVCDDLWK